MTIKNKLPLIIAVVSGILAVILVNIYLKQKESVLMKNASQKKMEISKEYTTVLVAKNDIPQGTLIDESMVEQKDVPRQFLQPRAATSLDRIINRIVSSDIAKGEQILLSKLTVPGRESSLAMKTPPGKRAITIPIDNISAVGGMIRPGDYVDVIGLIPVPGQTADGKQGLQPATVSLFQNVLILAVGSSISAYPQTEEAKRYKADDKSAVTAGTVTLALSPQEVSLISFVLEQGKVRLVLRSPTDTQVQPPALANWDSLIQYLYPEIVEKAQQQMEQTPATKQKTVEIYRGSQKEVVPLIKSNQ